MNRILQTILLISLFILAACSKHTEPPIDPPTPEPEARTRTVLVYMVANNDMGGTYDTRDINEMLTAAKAGDLNDGRLLVYHNAKSSVMLKEITSEGIDTLRVYPTSQVAVEASVMSAILEDVKTLAPSDEYGMVLWSHGSGWLQDGIADSGVAKAFGLDGTRRMNVTTLASVLEDQDMSFLYFDACYMGSVEVAYQLRHATPVIIAGPTEDPIDGMPYHLNLKNIFADTIDYELVAKTTFDYYNEVFTKGKCPCTMTVIRTAGLDTLADATRQIYQQAPQPWPEGYVPQKYTDSSKCYYYDFGDYVKTLAQDQTLLVKWQQAFDAVVTYSDATSYIWSTIPILKCSGLSTYIFRNDEDPDTKNYNQLEWYAKVASVFF